MRLKTLAVGALALWSCAGFAPAQEPDRDAQLEQARQQLEAAARRIAELSSDAIEPVQNRMYLRGLRSRTPRAVLGVGIDDDERGARVVGVTPGGGADEAGVRTGDVIVAMDGAALLGGEQGSPAEVLVAQMDNVEPGDTVSLTILRDGEERELEVEARPARARVFGYAVPPGGAGGPGFDFMRPIRRWADMEMVELTPGLGAYFGTEEGMLVVRAPRDESLGLQDGDVILQIGGRTPNDVGHALRILGSFEPDEQLELTIMRDRQRRTLEVEIPRAQRRD